MEGLKQFIHFRGKPMVLQSIDAALGAGLDPVVMVTGEEGMMPETLEDLPILTVENPQPEEGQSSSIRLGLEAIRDQTEAAVFFLADMPLISTDLVKALVKRHRQTLAPIILPIAGGRRGNPVLFDQVTFDNLRRLQGDRGGRALFDQYVIEHVEWDESIHFDVDSEDDLSKLREIE
jgi:molybdenum cofactor cytidylyltransferase